MSAHASMCVGASLGACACLPILTEWKLPAWHGQPSLCPHASACSPKSSPVRSFPLCPRLRSCEDRQVHLSSFLRPLLPPGRRTGAGLPEVVTRPLTRHPPRFAAMAFNTSGMIENWRIDVGGYAGLQVVGARPRLPAGGPAHGARGAEAGSLGRQQLELPAWHSSGPAEKLASAEEGPRAAMAGQTGRPGNTGNGAYKRLGRPGRLQGRP